MIFSNDQRFSVLIIVVSALKIAEFLLCNNTDHGWFSSETVIFIEIHAMCINYQFWIILKNLFTSLNQSGVSMVITESSKDVNPGSNEQDFFLQKAVCLYWLSRPETPSNQTTVKLNQSSWQLSQKILTQELLPKTSNEVSKYSDK